VDIGHLLRGTQADVREGDCVNDQGPAGACGESYGVRGEPINDQQVDRLDIYDIVGARRELDHRVKPSVGASRFDAKPHDTLAGYGEVFGDDRGHLNGPRPRLGN